MPAIPLEHQGLLLAYAERIRALRDPVAIVVEGMRLLRESLGADRCAFAEVEEDQDHFTFLGSAQAPNVEAARGRFPISAFGRQALTTIRGGRTYVATDILAEEAHPDVADATRIRGVIAVPLVRDGRLEAGTGVHAFTPRAWTATEVSLAEAITERCWEAIERARAEAAVKRSEAFYRGILDGQTEMLCRFRRDGTILFVNRAYAEARGCTAPELEGHSLWRFIPEADRPAVDALLAGLSPASPEVRIENRFVTVQGERWTLWTNRALVFDADGRWLEAQSAGIDITARKLAEEALREADARKTMLLTMLAHELRNPLAPIGTAAELIGRLGVAHDEQRKALAIIERQSRHLSRLLDDLLDAARITNGKVTIVRSEVDLRSVLAAAADTARPMLQAKGIAFEVTSPAEPVRVQGDHSRLVQVLDNLLSNSAHHTAPGGHVSLVLASIDGSATLEVRDDGGGIAPDLLPRIFDLFVQGELPLDRTRGGLGLGLTLVKELVALHGGVVTVSSPGTGRGTSARITLPLATASAEPAKPKPAPPRAARKVLVVEDNVDAAEMLTTLLQLDGHEVRMANDGRSALDVVAAWKPDLVFCDLGLPGMTGFEVAEAMRREPMLQGVRLVALSGYGRPEDKARTRDAGFDGHLVKPVQYEQLQRWLA